MLGVSSIVLPQRIEVHPYPSWKRRLDCACEPVMAWAQEYVKEATQETHFWNNRRLRPGELLGLEDMMVVNIDGDPAALRRLGWWDWRFHIPRWGGWREYVVLQPELSDSVWYPGWLWGESAGGISLKPLMGPVRLLRGPGAVSFFGVDAMGYQVPLRNIGYGRIGETPLGHAPIPLR